MAGVWSLRIPRIIDSTRLAGEFIVSASSSDLRRPGSVEVLACARISSTISANLREVVSLRGSQWVSLEERDDHVAEIARASREVDSERPHDDCRAVG